VSLVSSSLDYCGQFLMIARQISVGVSRLIRLAYDFIGNVKGTTAVMFALTLPVMLGGAGLAMDFATFAMKQTTLQAAADAAALAGAKQLSIASSQDSTIQASALAFLMEELRGRDETATGTVKVDRSKGTVQVLVSESWTPFFAHFIGAEITPVNVAATGALAGESKLCVLTLATGPMSFIMDHNAHVTAKGCAVYSNSTDKYSVYFGGAASIDAGLICSAGGVFGKGAAGITQVQTDCPVVANPLASVPKPVVAGCTYNNFNITTGIVALKAGTYCGGIAVSGNAVVNFDPGEYIIKDGLFKVTDNATINGQKTVFYLTGSMSLISFTKNATINLSGAETGSMAGLLFYEDPSSSSLRIHNINASHAYNLTGTLYLPKGILLIDPNANVGEDSAYTAIVANRLMVQQGPSLTLNTDYGATAVPVPSGLHASSTVVLTN
jgi:Flp pilus assembly protein TadG